QVGNRAQPQDRESAPPHGSGDASGTRRRGDRINLLQCECRLLAQSGQANMSALCPLWEAKRTLLGEGVVSAPDPSLPLAANFAVMHNAAFLIRTKVSFVMPSSAARSIQSARAHHAARWRGGTAARGVRA